MSIRSSSDAPTEAFRAGYPHWLVLPFAALLLAAVGGLDFATGKDVTFTFLYLAPVAAVAWFIGPRTGVVFCVLAAGIGLAIELADHSNWVTASWNAGIKFAVYTVFCTLLSYMHTHHSAKPVVRLVQTMVAVCVVLVCLLAASGGFLQRPLSAAAHSGSAKTLTNITPVVARNSESKSENKSEGPLAELETLIELSMAQSRPVLLGSRDPNGASCVQLMHTGDVVDKVPMNPGDLDGGPGTALATIYYFDRQGVSSPEKDFQWHQTRLRKFLENKESINRPAQESAELFEAKTKEFMELANSWTEIPKNINAIHFSHDDDWPSFCLARLDEAISVKDLPGVKRWSSELAAAAFSLADLHRWLGFLLQNQLRALDFQKQCASLFASAEALAKPYDPSATISQFPAGVLSLNGNGNYYEVERQAEQLFSMPQARRLELATGKAPTAGNIWISPVHRELFSQLEEVLSPENQKVWEAAAKSPYDHSFLVNMLFRASVADVDENLRTVLKKFNALQPSASSAQLLSVLTYRGHAFAGLEWGDRFQPELLAAADEIKPSETDLEAIMDACRWTNKFYEAPAKYGVTFTLRSALEEKRLDCVRATDMIASIFRNAGRIGVGNVRWCSETLGHSVAAYLSPNKETVKALLVDGLDPNTKPELWPECYFHGHAWPPGFEGNTPPYAAELYIRGLDSYIWAEGYIIRGPNAGTFYSVDIPYSTHHHEDFSKKIFNGPYPE